MKRIDKSAYIDDIVELLNVPEGAGRVLIRSELTKINQRGLEMLRSFIRNALAEDNRP
jgi:hypothetical protein